MSSTEIDTLQNLLGRAGSQHFSDLKLALTRLSVDIGERKAKGSSASYDFFVSAVEVLSRLRGTAHAELRLNCLFESGLFFYRAGYARAALETSQKLDSLARRVESKAWTRKARNLSGIVHSDAGNIAEAVLHYCEALKIARETGETYAEIAVLTNLASAFIYGSLNHEAIRCLSRAVELCNEPSLRPYLAPAYCDMAQAYLALEDYPNAFIAITRSLETSSEPTDSAGYFGRTIREYTYVQIALELGKLARAREHAAACRYYSQWGDNPRCKTLAEIVTGLCEIRGGDVDRGLVQLEKALINSGEFVASRLDALSALVKAYDEVERPERALGLMREMLSFVRTMRQQSIDAVFAVGGSAASSLLTTEHASDVRALELREARLRAKVAEQEVVNTQVEMLERLAITADLKEECSGQHGYRVGRLAALVAQRIGYDRESMQSLELAARLHDIGKVGVPDRILFTSNALKEAERSLMCAHAVVGAELLGKSDLPRLQVAEQIARYHHEWFDGTGYPSKLSGKRIPIHARIVALADVFDALTHGRPYAPAWSIDKALEEIRSRRGTQFDPDLTDTFLALIEDLRREHSDLDGFLAEASRNSPFLQARDRIRLMLEGERRAEKIEAEAADTVH